MQKRMNELIVCAVCWWLRVLRVNGIAGIHTKCCDDNKTTVTDNKYFFLFISTTKKNREAKKRPANKKASNVDVESIKHAFTDKNKNFKKENKVKATHTLIH